MTVRTEPLPAAAPQTANGRTLSEALDIVPSLPLMRAFQISAAASIRQILFTDARDCLAQAYLPADLALRDLDYFDHVTIIRIRTAVIKALGSQAERSLRKALKAFFPIALSQSWLTSDPMLKQPKVVGQYSVNVLGRQRRLKRHDMPDAEQIALLLSDCDDWVALADWLTIEASCRCNEVRGAIWSDITLHEPVDGEETGGSIDILRTMGSGPDPEDLVPGPLKNKQSQRVVEFGPGLAAALRAKMPPPGRRHTYIVSPDGRPVSTKALYYARKARQVRLGIAYWEGDGHGHLRAVGDFLGRKLRHAFAARRIAEGVTHKVLSRLMGHKRHGITLDIYGYLLPKAAEAKKARMRTAK